MEETLHVRRLLERILLRLLPLLIAEIKRLLHKSLLRSACAEHALERPKPVVARLSTDAAHQLPCTQHLADALHAIPGTKLTGLLAHPRCFERRLLVELLRREALTCTKLLNTKQRLEILRPGVVAHLLICQHGLKRKLRILHVGCLLELPLLQPVLTPHLLVGLVGLLHLLRREHVRGLLQLSALETVLAEHLHVGLAGLLLHLRVLHRSVVLLLSVELPGLHPRLLVRQQRLKPRRLIQLLRLKSCLRPQTLRLKPCAEVLHIGLLLSLLIGKRGLQRLLLVHPLRLKAVRLRLNRCLLLVRQICQCRLKPRLSTKLLNTELCSKVLLPHRQTGADVGLLRSLPRLLLLVELLLCLLERTLQPRGCDVAKLRLQIALCLCFLDSLPRTTKRPSLRIPSASSTTGDISLSNGFAGLLVHHPLHVR